VAAPKGRGSWLSPFMVDLVMPRFDSVERSSLVQFREVILGILYCTVGKLLFCKRTLAKEIVAGNDTIIRYYTIAGR
jgi:hypothetical protein